MKNIISIHEQLRQSQPEKLQNKIFPKKNILAVLILYAAVTSRKKKLETSVSIRHIT